MADDKKPTINSVYKERVKILDETVKKYIKNSEKSGNTPDTTHFDNYLKWVIKNKCLADSTGLSVNDNNIIYNTLYNHASIDLKSKYKTSLELNPRVPNNKDPKEVTSDWEKEAKKLTKTVRSGIRDKAKETLSQSVKSGRTPSQRQFLDYLSGQMNTLVEDLPETYQDYVKAYVQSWINTTAKDLYETNLKSNPRKVTNDFPWSNTSDSSKDKNGKSSTTNPLYDYPMSQYGDTYRSFSGHDMVCTVDMPMPDGSSYAKVIGALQTVTYSIHDEKVPIRCIGDMNAKGYVFGPRTVAGTLIFSVFDRHWLKDFMKKYVDTGKKYGAHFLADEMPSFNMTISCANEYGHDARLAIYGITLVNEGQVMSINDVYTENTYEFFAMDVDYLTDVVSKSASSQKKGSSTLPQTSGKTTEKNPVVIHLDESGSIVQEGASTEVTKGTDPDKGTSEYHDSDYYTSTSKQDMYDAIKTSKDNTNMTISAKYGRGEITAEELQRLRTKNQEIYSKRMQAAAEYYEKQNTNSGSDSGTASGSSSDKDGKTDTDNKDNDKASSGTTSGDSWVTSKT